MELHFWCKETGRQKPCATKQPATGPGGPRKALIFKYNSNVIQYNSHIYIYIYYCTKPTTLHSPLGCFLGLASNITYLPYLADRFAVRLIRDGPPKQAKWSLGHASYHIHGMRQSSV